MLIKELLCLDAERQNVTIRGWVRTKRELKNLIFIEVNDGSCLTSIQCVFDHDNDTLAAVSTGCSVEIRGELTPSPSAGQKSELAAKSILLIGGADAYPLQKKRHSMEFLREIAHLRARTNTFGAVARTRSRLAFAVHEFFQNRDFQYIHTPIITANDAEGAGAMFQVTALDKANVSQPIDYSSDFFGKKAFLTVSGQLEAETYASALSCVYTFGPTFRAENSNTARHLAEFWMIEPEAAFADLEDNMKLAEEFLKFVFTTALEKCAEDLAFFDAHIQRGVAETLRKVVESRFVHITYTQAIEELEKQSGKFEFKPFWGCDLQSEHEKFLTESVVGGPVVVTDYPKEIKAFYMKMNDDGRTVRAMDVLVPRLGEIIGGSQREESLERLESRMTELGMNAKDYSWYLDLRRFGSVPHSGFGVGFERLILYITGMANIRDVIPYPRVPGLIAF
jgi:asparaginyl-tRNA synthetase